jgi:type 1 glutamine amidotransferase
MNRVWRSLILLSVTLIATTGRSLLADEPGSAPSNVKKIKALIVTGGCCHDYEKQKKILTEGIAARAPVEFTVVHQGGTATTSKIALYEDENWAKGFDVVIHNECFSDIPDPTWTARILKPHREGLPAVVVHCAMHCYRDKTDEWFKFLGVTSHRHGAHYAFDVQNVAPDHPVMQGFPEKWTTPKGELYQIVKLWDTAKPLGRATSRETKNAEPCIWVNMYNGNTRVFGTTVGHYNEEMEDPIFLNYITRGLLWSVNQLDDQHFKAIHERSKVTGPEPTPAKKK